MNPLPKKIWLQQVINQAIYLSAIWPPHGQLWAIIGGTHSPDFNHCYRNEVVSAQPSVCFEPDTF